jgi:hypothetical protein
MKCGVLAGQFKLGRRPAAIGRNASSLLLNHFDICRFVLSKELRSKSFEFKPSEWAVIFTVPIRAKVSREESTMIRRIEMLAVAILMAIPLHAAVYQYKAPVGTRTAYLWVPPQARHVRGIVFAMENMLERNWLEDPIVRQACAREKLGIVWLSAGDASDHLITWEMSPASAHAIEQMFVDLAKVSGFVEIEYVPLILTGHSFNGRMWLLTRRIPDRVIAVAPIRSYPLPGSLGFDGIPMLYIVGQTTELPEFNDGKPGDRDFYLPRLQMSALALRQSSDENLLGVAVEAGGTHTDWSQNQARLLAMFLEDACKYRLPRDAPHSGPVQLRPVAPQSGWLADATGMEPERYRPAPYAKYRGDPKQAYWFFDGAIARAAMALAGDRKPRELQMPTFVDAGKPLPVEMDGYVHPPLHLEDDGVTFNVSGGFLPVIPAGLVGAGKPLGHGTPAFTFRVIMGPVMQVGPHTFRVQFDRQQPRDIMIEVEQPADGRYRHAVQPAKIHFPPVLREGKPQKITFPAITDRKRGVPAVRLNATSDSGLPVSYYVDAGPAEVSGDLLRITQIPARSVPPIEITVVAYQWGRMGTDAVQSAVSVKRSFLLR